MSTLPTKADIESGILQTVALPGRKGCFDLAIKNGHIDRITPSPRSTPAALALPGFYEPHVHANRAYKGNINDNPSLEQAIADSLEDRRNASSDDYRERARQLFRQAAANGVQRIRTHTDVDELAALRAVTGVLEAKSVFQGTLDVEVIAFATSKLDPATTEGGQLLQQAIDLGVDVLGAVPAFYNDPQASIDRVLELAATHQLKVDFHLDEHLDAEKSQSEYLAKATLKFGMQGQVALSHGCVLSELPQKQATGVIEKLALAEVTVITMPATNLYVQDRQQGSPQRRGTTLVKELIEAGVKVLIGSDNVQDFFYPYGNADPLEAAWLASLATHLDNPLDLIRGLCDGNAEIAVSDPANLVVIPTNSIQQALAIRPKNRMVIRQGKVVTNANTEPH